MADSANIVVNNTKLAQKEDMGPPEWPTNPEVAAKEAKKEELRAKHWANSFVHADKFGTP